MRLLRLHIYEDAIVYAYKEMYPFDLIPRNKIVCNITFIPHPVIPVTHRIY